MHYRAIVSRDDISGGRWHENDNGQGGDTANGAVVCEPMACERMALMALSAKVLPNVESRPDLDVYTMCNVGMHGHRFVCVSSNRGYLLVR